MPGSESPGTRDASGPRAFGPPTRTLHERVYRILARGLSSGEFAPEALLSIRMLAAKLGTSAMPVRAALSRLAAARALVPGPNRSFRVPPVTRERLVELASARAALEGRAAELATPRIAAEGIDRLASLNALMREATGKQDQAAYFANNRDFHWTIYQAAGQTLLGEMIEDLWLQNGPIHYFIYADFSIFARSVARHDAVIEALRHRDAALARDAIVFDIVTANDYVVEHLDRLHVEAQRLKGASRRHLREAGEASE